MSGAPQTPGATASANKLNYAVHFVTSEDRDFPATELHRRTKDTRGWCSDKFCDIPQELIFKFDTVCSLEKLQVLAHEFKIPSRIEIFAHIPGDRPSSTTSLDRGGTFPSRFGAKSDDIDAVTVKRLGFISMDRNEKTQLKARELKTVQINVEKAVALQLNLHKCHVNGLNLYNQVALIAVGIYGKPLSEPVARSLHSPTSPVYNGQTRSSSAASSLHESVDLSLLTPPSNRSSKKKGSGKEDLSHFDSKTAGRIRELIGMKDQAVAGEDFVAAAHLKTMIERLKSAGIRISELERKKQQAVCDEDFETAQRCKQEIDYLRSAGEAGGRNAALGSDGPAVNHRPVSGRAEGFGPQPHGYPDPADTFAWARARSSPQQPDTLSPAHGLTHLSIGEPTIPDPFPRQAEGVARKSPNFSRREAPPAIVREAALPALSKTEDNGRPHSEPFSYPGNAFDDKPVTGAVSYEQLLSGNPEASKESRSPSSNTNARTNLSLKQLLASVKPWEAAVIQRMQQLVPEFAPPDEDVSMFKDFQPLSSVFGGFLATCALCSAWNIREAVATALLEFHEKIPADAVSKLRAIEKLILKQYMNDKHVQVTIAGLQWLAGAVSAAVSELSASELSDCIHHFFPPINERLGDSNAKLRETLSSFLVEVAELSIDVSASTVVEGLLVPAFMPQSKAKKLTDSNWRFVVTRISILATIVQNVGIPAKVHVNDILKFAFEQGLGNSNGQVRTAAMGLVADIHSLTGLKPIQPFFVSLKPVLVEEIQRMCNERSITSSASAARSSSGNAERTKKTGSVSESPSEAAMGSPTKRQPHPNKTVRTAASIKTAVDQGKWPLPEEDECTCQFCGLRNPQWTDQDLDAHYWQECPMLSVCKECGQVIELALYNDHLLNECQNSGQYVRCNKCEFAIPRGAHPNHVRTCQRTRSQTTCVLCLQHIPSGPVGWQKHYLGSHPCANNPRCQK